MSDGAHLHVGADRALGTILGGDPEPSDDERMSPEAFAAYIRAEPTATGYDYGEAARLLARAALLMAEAHPEIDWATVPADDELDLGPDDGRTFEQRWAARQVRREGFDTLWKRFDPAGYRAILDDIGPSGFQFGWAVNAVRTVLGLPPTPNPALMTVSVPTDGAASPEVPPSA